LKRRAVRILIPLILLSLSILSNQSSWLHLSVPVHAQGSTLTSVFLTGPGPSGSGNVTDLAKMNKTITFGVNVSESDPINLFFVNLHYNTAVLSFSSIDYIGNVLGSAVTPLILCVDGGQYYKTNSTLALNCQTKDGTDKLGAITLSLYLLGGISAHITDGLLFHVKFNIIGVGLAQVHIYSAVLSNGSITSLGKNQGVTSTRDGYYTNMACPVSSGVACKPPTVSFTISPPTPSLNAVATANGTVIENNPNAKVLSFTWDWGDAGLTDPQNSTTRWPLGMPIPHIFGQSGFSSGGFGCAPTGFCRVSLTVFDNQGVSWEITRAVTIVHVFIQLSVGVITLDHQFNVLAGTLVHITAHIINDSTIAENATLSITLERTKLLNSSRYSLSPLGTIASLDATWNTTGYIPRVYEIVVIISSVTSAGQVSGKFITAQNNTSNNVRSYAVLLVIPQIMGALSLSLLQTTGLGILVVIGAGVGLARFRRKPSYETEPL